MATPTRAVNRPERVLTGTALALVMLAGVACGGGQDQTEAERVGKTSATTAIPATTAPIATPTPTMPTTTTTFCSTLVAEIDLGNARDSLAQHQAAYDLLKPLAGPDAQVVANFQYLLDTATRRVERARADVTEATADFGTAQTWEDYEQAQEMLALAKDALVEAEAYQKKLQGDLARAKAGDPVTKQRLSTLQQQITQDRQRIVTTEAEIAKCQ
jgi:hypothetical protein